MSPLPFHIGLKLYSTNTHLIPIVQEYGEKGRFSFIELYIIPGSRQEHLAQWRRVPSKFIIHAPHSFQGVNLAVPDRWSSNKTIFDEVFAFSNELAADLIIVHGGINGSFDETLHQISKLGDQRIVLENKPKLGIKGERCVGWAPHEFEGALQDGKLNGMALDFVHAACAANSQKSSFQDYVRDFQKLTPKIYHLSDADASSLTDNHLNIGKGTMDLKFIITCIPDEAMVTLETPRQDPNSLEDYKQDIRELTRLLKVA